MNPYEKAQIKAIELWKRQEPGIVSLALDTVTAPMTWLVSKVIPIALVQGAIEGADFIAQGATDAKDILRDGEVSSIDALRTKDLQLSDRIVPECG